MRPLALAALLAATLVPAAHAGDRPWTPEAIQSLRHVSDPQVSPDGGWVACVIRERSADGTGSFSNLWRAPIDRTGDRTAARCSPVDGTLRRLTQGAQHDDSPRWSPDGTRLAFVSDRARPGAAAAPPGVGQLWLLPVDGGDAAPLTDLPAGAFAPQWSADGRFLAFLSPESEADTSAAIRAAAGAASPAARVPWNRLWVVDVASGRARRLTRGALHVTSFSIAPDGTRIVCAAQPSPAPGAANDADLWMVPVQGGDAAPFVRRPGEEQGPAFSPDGRWVAFLGHADGHPEYWANRHVFLINAAGGAPSDLTPDFDEQAEGVREGEAPIWDPLDNGSARLLFVATSRTDRRIYRAFEDARPPEVVMKSTGVDAEPNLGGHGRVLAWVHEESTQPADVWVWPLAAGAPHPLTDVNPEAAQYQEIPKRPVSWSAPDGRQVEGLLIPPVAPVAGTPPPLLVVLHGGPAWTHVAGFTAANPVYPYALLAQHGWAVLLPNPRGSAGYGADFRAALAGDWGGKDAQDVLSGVDELVRTGLADSSRLAVCGWSYGGYLAATLVTQTDRFKAAIVGAGMTDLGAMAASDVPELSRWYLGAWPWEDPAAYTERSPLYHAGRIRTPTAFVHGAADTRVPPDQALALWQALVRRGVPTDFLLLPNEPHLPFDPRHQLAAMRFHLDWLERYVTAKPPAAGPPVAAPARKGKRTP